MSHTLADKPISGEAFRAIDPDGWYTVSQVTKLCRVDRMTVLRWLRAGKLVGTKQAGNYWRVSGASVIATAPGIYTASPEKVETAAGRAKRAADAMGRIGGGK